MVLSRRRGFWVAALASFVTGALIIFIHVGFHYAGTDHHEPIASVVHGGVVNVFTALLSATLGWMLRN